MNKDLYFLSIHDKFGNYLKVCDNITNITGYSKSDIIGKSSYEFFDPNDIKNIVSSHISNTLTSVRYKIRKSDGSFVYVKTLSFKSVNSGEDDSLIHCITRKMNKVEILLFKLETKLKEIIELIRFKIDF